MLTERGGKVGGGGGQTKTERSRGRRDRVVRETLRRRKKDVREDGRDKTVCVCVCVCV